MPKKCPRSNQASTNAVTQDYKASGVLNFDEVKLAFIYLFAVVFVLVTFLIVRTNICHPKQKGRLVYFMVAVDGWLVPMQNDMVRVRGGRNLLMVAGK